MYLAYNKALSVDAQNKFNVFDGVTVSTVHSLAYRSDIEVNEPTSTCISKLYNVSDSVATDYQSEFNTFCNTLTELIQCQSSVARHETGNNTVHTRRLFEGICNVNANLRYDIILLDEVQDCTDVILSLVMNQHRPAKVFVGDRFWQNSYGFKHVHEPFEFLRRPETRWFN